MANDIAYIKNYTTILDEVYKRAACSTVLNSGRRIVRAGRNAKEIEIPKISVTGLGDYTRNVGYKTGAITYEFETKRFDYDRGIRCVRQDSCGNAVFLTARGAVDKEAVAAASMAMN